MRNPALSRVVRGLSSRTSTAAIIAGLVLVAPISKTIGQQMGGFAGTVANSTPGISASSSSITFNSSIAGTDHGVINWTPTDDAVNAGAPIDFLPSGQSVTFSGSGSPYTILNRIVPTDASRPLALNGTINSYLGFPSGPNGGSIWFYSPAGILVGGGAVFNIGSLLLTTADPGNTNGFLATDQFGQHFSLGQANNGSKVTIASGAQINAMSQTGSYVALIAPSITQSGMVTVNGSAAYVAARGANMTINQGLFDISVTMPTEETGPQLIHNGTTGMSFTDTDSPGALDLNHRIYLVSVPKNDAITMLIQGGSQLGFDIAGGATVQGSAIILSAGRNIAEASSNIAIDSSSTPTAASASIAMNGGNFRSAVIGEATRNAIVSNGGTGADIHFASNLTLTAPNLVSVTSAVSGKSVLIDGHVHLDASVNATTDGETVTGGTAQLFATGGGAITVGNGVDLLAKATGNGSTVNMNVPVGANGGIAQIVSVGGAIDISGATALDAGVTSGSSDDAPATALALIAGHTNVQADGPGASIYLHGGVTAFASAVGDFDVGGSTANGTSAQGGNVLLENSGGGTVTVDGLASLSADGIGQDVGSGPVGGAGAGGQIIVNASDGAMILNGGLQATAGGFGGNSYDSALNGGAGTGGQITVGAGNAGGSLTIGQFDTSTTLDLNAEGSGGSGGPIGGNGLGGGVHLVANGGTTHVYGPTYLFAHGSGGYGVLSGNAQGGLAEVTAFGGTVILDGAVQLSATAFSSEVNNSQSGTPHVGAALGGTTQIVTGGTGQITVNDDVDADARASAPFDVYVAAGGDATAGTFNLFANGTGNIHIAGDVTANMRADGGDSQITAGTPGFGRGGNVFVDARDTTTVTIDGLLSGAASGYGGRATTSGTGGSGTGGRLAAGGGSGHLVLNAVDFDASGYGGAGIIAGGTGLGGSATVQTFTQGGVVQISTGVEMHADGIGGDGAVDSRVPDGMVSTGGNGSGGDASVFAQNGAITIGDHIAIFATGTGGDGYHGGTGIGGGVNSADNIGAELYVSSGSLTLTSPASPSSNPYPVQLVASGTGGAGGTAMDGTAGHGGAGMGGYADIFASNTGSTGQPSTVSLPTTVNIFAYGAGGDGGDDVNVGIGGAGGAGTGGQILVDAQVGDGHISTNALILDSTGFGGTGGAGQTGGAGGAGMGGFNQAGVYSGTLTATTTGTGDFGAYTSYALGLGGDGGDGTATGTGGAGGAGRGGAGSIVSRGGTVTASSADLLAYGAGGIGGAGNIQGVGGDGRGGHFSLLSTPRFQTTTTGSLTVSGDVTGTASGIGGNGSQTGATSVGDFLVQAIGGSLTAQNIYASASGAVVPADAVASEIAATGTGVISTTQFSASSGGDIGLFLDGGGTITATSASLFARSVTPFGGAPEGDGHALPPTGSGIFNANSMTFNVQQDFRTAASFTTPGAFMLAAPGAIETGAITAGGALSLNFNPGTMTSSHGASVSTGDLISGGNVVIRADGATTVGSVNAALGINLNFDTAAATHGSSLTTGNLITGRTALLQSDGNMSIGTVAARDSLISVAMGTTTIGDISAGRGAPLASTPQGYVINVFSNSGATIGATTAAGEIRFGTLNGSIGAGNVVTDRDLIVLARQNVSLGSVITAQASTVGGPTGNQTTNPGGIYIGHSNGTIVSAAQTFATDPTPIEGSILIAGPVATGIFNVAALGNLTIGTLNPATGITFAALNTANDIQADIGGTIGVGAITTGQSIHLRTAGNARYGALVAGDTIQVAAGGTLTVASASAGRVNPSSAADSDYQIGLQSSAGTTVGNVTAKGNIGLLATNGDVTAGTVTTDQSFVALSANNISTGPITTLAQGTGAGIYLANASMYPLVQNDLIPATLFAIAPVATAGSIQIGGPVTTSAFVAAAQGTFASSSITAGDRININFDSTMGAAHGTGLSTGDLASGRNVLLQTDGNASVGSVTASDSIITVSGGTTSIGNLSAGRINRPQFTGIGYVANVFAGGGSTIGSVDAKGEVRFQSLNGSISAGNIVTDRDLVVLAGQNVSLGSITTALVPTVGGPTNGQTGAPGGVYIGRAAGTFVPAGQLFATDPTRVGGSIAISGPVTTGIFKAAASGSFNAGSINANSFLYLDAGGAITLNSLVSRYDAEITGDGAFTIGSMDTGGEGNVEVAGQVTVNSATAGRMKFSDSSPSNPNQPLVNTASDSGPSVVLVGGAGVSLGTASASGDIGLVSNGNVVVTGALTSDASVGALVGGNVTLASVTTGADANGLYIGNSSLYPQVRDSDGNAAEILFAQQPPRTGGSISLGTVSTGRVLAASGGAFTTSSIAATTDISIDSGGLATFNGAITAPTISIGSLDVAVGSTGSIGGTATSSLTLTSGATDTAIGGSAPTGQTGAATTYLLDNAEFGRLRAAQINVAAQGDVKLGALNINGSGSSSGNLVGSNARFQVQTPGSIRVVGSVDLANAASTDTLGFIAGQRFEIVTDTGQVRLLGADGKPGGIAAITAANIAVGTSSIVSQLAANPKFAGRDSLLASAPLTGGKLDGYLQAGRMKFTVGNTLLIQNSGVGDTLAGFTVGSGGIQIANSGTSPIDVVIYGRAFDSSGAEIPTASIGSVVTASQTSGFSNVDGCVFATGACSPVNTGASAQMVAQAQLASISSSIQSAIVGNVGAGAPPAIDNGTSSVGSSVGDGSGGGSGGGDDDEGGGEAKGNGGGAAKPNVLIDTNAIASNAAPQVDTPVTSSGNTSLWIGEDGLTGDIGTGNNQ